jgi:hypothetical protein
MRERIAVFNKSEAGKHLNILKDFCTAPECSDESRRMISAVVGLMQFINESKDYGDGDEVLDIRELLFTGKVKLFNIYPNNHDTAEALQYFSRLLLWVYLAIEENYDA